MFDDIKRYMQKVREQIGQYEHTQDMHAQLSDIFRYWQTKYFKPRFLEVCEAENHLEFYYKSFARRIRETGCGDIVSFGSGDAQVEAGVAAGLKKAGINDFCFHCVELSPYQIKRAKEMVGKAGLTDNFTFVDADFI